MCRAAHVKLLQRVCAGAKVAAAADTAVARALAALGDRSRRRRARAPACATASSRSTSRPAAGSRRSASFCDGSRRPRSCSWCSQPVAIGTRSACPSPTSRHSTSAAAELDDVEDAYRRLRGLRGFAAARRRAVARRARPPEPSRDDVRGGYGGRHALAGRSRQGATADRLLGEFWLRRAREQAHAEQRDAAILLAQRAARCPARRLRRQPILTELVGDDYARLERSLRLGSSPEYWHMGFAEAALVTIDAGRQASRTLFGADRYGRARRRARRARRRSSTPRWCASLT